MPPHRSLWSIRRHCAIRQPLTANRLPLPMIPPGSCCGYIRSPDRQPLTAAHDSPWGMLRLCLPARRRCAVSVAWGRAKRHPRKGTPIKACTPEVCRILYPRVCRLRYSVPVRPDNQRRDVVATLADPLRKPSDLRGSIPVTHLTGVEYPPLWEPFVIPS